MTGLKKSIILGFLSILLVFACINTNGQINKLGNPEKSDYQVDSLIYTANTFPLKNLRMGPFIKIDKDVILTVDSTNSYISRDNGISWIAYPIFSQPEKFLIRTERALIKTKSGVIILAFANEKEKANWNWNSKTHDAPDAELPTYTIRSLDNGITWSNLQLIHKDWTGANRDMIETKEGNVIFTSMKMKHQPGHHTVLTYTSKDNGISWTASNLLDMGGTGHHSGVTESTITELSNGKLWMLLRTNWGKFYQTYSIDQGLNWSNPEASSIDASSAPAMIKRLSSGKLVLVWNRYFPEGKTEYPLKGGDMEWSDVAVSNHREELSIIFSDNDGLTWTKPQVIAKVINPKNQVSYPYLFERNPGEIWVTTMYGGLRLGLREIDFDKGPKQFYKAPLIPNFGMRLRSTPKKANDIYAPVILKEAPTNESTIIRLSSGKIKIFFINRPGKADKMMSITSSDEGLTWSEPVTEFALPGEAYYANQVLLDSDSTLHCVFHLYGTGNYGYRGRHLDIWHSYQKKGQTWTNPKKIFDGYVGSMRGFIQLKNKRLLIPITEADPARANKPSSTQTDFGLFGVVCLYSDDKGEHWQKTNKRLDIPVDPNQVTRYGAVEPNILELNDGKIWMLIRTNKGYLYESFSNDAGSSWTEPKPSIFISSDSPASTVRLKDGSILLIWSSNQRYDDKRSYANGGREVLHAAISYNEGKTWQGGKEILHSLTLPSPKGDRGTAYPSAIETKQGTILMVSGQGEADRSILSFSLKWLNKNDQKDDFANGLEQWTFYGTEKENSLTEINGKKGFWIGKNIPNNKTETEAVWNFPMTSKGEIEIKLLLKNDATSLKLALSDHFSIAGDSLASKNAIINEKIEFSTLGNTHQTQVLKIHWNNQTKQAQLIQNGKKVRPLNYLHSPNFGLNYLRIGVKNEGAPSDKSGIILLSVASKSVKD